MMCMKIETCEDLGLILPCAVLARIGARVMYM